MEEINDLWHSEKLICSFWDNRPVFSLLIWALVTKAVLYVLILFWMLLYFVSFFLNILLSENWQSDMYNAFCYMLKNVQYKLKVEKKERKNKRNTLKQCAQRSKNTL